MTPQERLKKTVLCKLALDGYAKAPAYYFTADGELFLDANPAHAHGSINKLYTPNENGGNSVLVFLVRAEEIPGKSEANEMLVELAQVEEVEKQTADDDAELLLLMQQEEAEKALAARVTELMDSGLTEAEAMEEIEKEKSSQ